MSYEVMFLLLPLWRTPDYNKIYCFSFLLYFILVWYIVSLYIKVVLWLKLWLFYTISSWNSSLLLIIVYMINTKYLNKQRFFLLYFNFILFICQNLKIINVYKIRIILLSFTNWYILLLPDLILFLFSIFHFLYSIVIVKRIFTFLYIFNI